MKGANIYEQLLELAQAVWPLSSPFVSQKAGVILFFLVYGESVTGPLNLRGSFQC